MTSSLEDRLVLVVAAVSGVVAATAGCSPAGWRPADLVWTAAFGGLVTLAAGRAPAWTSVVPAAVGLVAVDETTLIGLAVAGVAAALSANVLSSRLLGAIAVGAGVNVLLRVDLDTTGLSALVTAAAVLPVLVGAWLGLGPGPRRVVRRSAVGVAGFCLLAAVGLAVAVGLGYGDVQDGADGVRDGLEAVRQDQPAAAVDQLEAAARRLDAAHGAVSTFGLAARAVPLLGHQAAAVEVVTGEGATLAGDAAVAAAEADTDTLRFDDGRLDLDAIAGFEQPLADAYASLVRADERLDDVRSPWLLDPLAGGADDFADEVDDALPVAELAAEGVRLAPGLLGADGPRSYFIAFTQPAEARGLGGFVGNFGLLTADDGQLDLARSGRIGELRNATDPATRTISGPADYLDRYARFHPEVALQDVTLSPDMPSVGQVYEELYPQVGGDPVDGVIVVDPVALAGFLQFTGPIQVDGLDEPLTADNAADVLIREQYLQFPEDENERIEVLDEASRRTFEALTTGDLPSPRQVGDVLGPVVDQGRLLMHAVDPDEQHLVELAGLDGALPPVGDGDFLSLVSQNSGNNKIDMFLHRNVRYEVEYDPGTGAVDATATVVLRNDAPADGLPEIVLDNNGQGYPRGTNAMQLSWYTPLVLEGATVDGEVLPVRAERERGRWVYTADLLIGPGRRQEVVLHLAGVVASGSTYRLGVAPQPLANADRLAVVVRPADGWHVAGTDGLERRGDRAVGDEQLVVDSTLSARFERR
jgi:hypothetical protein